MEALAHSANVVAITHPKELVPPHAVYSEVEIDCWLPGTSLSTSTTAYHLPVGMCKVRLAPEDVVKAQAEIEDMDLVARCQERFERAIDAQMAQARKAGDFPAWEAEHPGQVLDKLALKEARTRSARTAGDNEILFGARGRAWFLQRTGDSWQRYFAEEAERSPKPFKSVRVLSDGHLHPEQVRKQEYEVDQARKVAELMRPALRAAAGNEAEAGKRAKG